MIYSEQLMGEGRLLALAIRAAPSSEERAEINRLHQQLGAEAVRAAARRNQIEALVGLGLQSAGIALNPEWSQAVERNGERVEALTQALSAVVARLNASGIASAAIEAGGVLLGSGLDPRGYCPGDIDLLVDAARWHEVPAAFQAEGFGHRDRRARPTRRIEFRREAPGGTVQWLEAGAEPFDRMWVPLRFRDCSQTWLAQRVPARKGRGLFVLEPAEALAFVAIHTSMHSYVRAPGLRLQLDVDRLVRDNRIDWDRFERAVTDAGARRRAFVSLAMAVSLMATPIPDEVLRRLHPGDPVWGRIDGLLASEGVLATGRSKLGRVRSLWLDLLLEENGAWPWIRSILMPPGPWMREHFDRRGGGLPLWRLHARRATMLLSGWRPE